MSCQHPHIEILKPNVMVCGDGVFGSCLIVRVLPSRSGTKALRDPKELPCFSYRVKNLHPRKGLLIVSPSQTSSFQIFEKHRD